MAEDAVQLHGGRGREPGVVQRGGHRRQEVVVSVEELDGELAPVREIGPAQREPQPVVLVVTDPRELAAVGVEQSPLDPHGAHAGHRHEVLVADRAAHQLGELGRHGRIRRAGVGPHQDGGIVGGGAQIPRRAVAGRPVAQRDLPCREAQVDRVEVGGGGIVRFDRIRHDRDRFDRGQVRQAEIPVGHREVARSLEPQPFAHRPDA